MHKLRGKPILALVGDEIQREALVWCAWTVATAAGARIHVVGRETTPEGVAAWRTVPGLRRTDAPAPSLLEAVRSFARTDPPAMIVADWPAGPGTRDLLGLVEESRAGAAFVRWPRPCSVGRVLAFTGGGKVGEQMWVAREIAARHACPVHAVHVVSTPPNLNDSEEDERADSHAAMQTRALGVPKTLVVPADDVLSGMVANVRPDDLIVVGAPNHWRIPALLEGSVPDRLARHLPNPMLMLMGSRPSSLSLRDVFWPQMIRLGLRAETKEEAISQLVDTLVSHDQIPDEWRDAILGKALARELAMSTAAGDETAFPHIQMPGAAGIAGCLGVFPEGIDFGGGDGERTRFVFLLLSPDTVFNEYLHVLARIAARMIVPEVRRELLASPTSHAALNILDPGGGDRPPLRLRRAGRFLQGAKG